MSSSGLLPSSGSAPIALPTILEAILSDIKPSKLTDAQTLKLHFLLPKELVLAAVELIDLGHVLSPFASSSAGFLQITSTSDPTKPYTLHLSPSSSPSHSVAPKASCSCPAWAFNLHKISLARAKMKEKGQDPGSELGILICKHVLAARLAIALGKVRPASSSAGGNLWSGVG